MSKKEIQRKEAPTLRPVSSFQSSNINRDVYYENVKDSLGYFTPDNAPEDYTELKREVKVLEKIHSTSFLVLSHRLKIIRDRELYREDGYLDFKSFIEGEMDITRTTVYRYLSLLDIFKDGVTSMLHEDYKVTSLFLIAPYIQRYPEKKNELLAKTRSLSVRELTRYLSNEFSLNKEKESEEENSIHFYTSEEELINNSNFVRAGMKAKTVKAILKDMTNWFLIHEPKNKELKKIMESLKKL